MDDDPDTRSMLTDYLTYCGYTVWETGDGERALDLAQTQVVDIVLLDVVMPRFSGFELIPRFRALQPEVVIILVTAYGTVPQAVEAMRLGAFDYLEKPLQLRELQTVVERAWQTKQAPANMLGNLTNREREVLGLLADGKTDAEIAEALCLSIHTVNSHLRKIYTKLNVKSRTEAVAVCLRRNGK